MTYYPLRTPEQTTPPPAPLDEELELARELLAVVGDFNIHDHKAMVRVAASLMHRLSALADAVDAERGDAL